MSIVDYLAEYQEIVKGLTPPVYSSPDKQGAAIQRCSLLTVTNIEYDNKTSLKTTPTR